MERADDIPVIQPHHGEVWNRRDHFEHVSPGCPAYHGQVSEV